MRNPPYKYYVSKTGTVYRISKTTVEMYVDWMREKWADIGASSANDFRDNTGHFLVPIPYKRLRFFQSNPEALNRIHYEEIRKRPNLPTQL